MVVIMPKLDVEISPLAYSKIIDWTSSNTEREIGGYLIGFIDEGKVIITEAIFATAESNPTFVSFDNMMQFKIIEELEKKGSNEAILGWFHSHPGLSCFMSGTDIATQKIYQALLPESIAMVNDGNQFAKTRNQKDYKVKFFRVNENKAYEISYNIMTDPNNLVDLLTKHVQDQENAEKIAQFTARQMVLSIDESLNELTKNKLLLKEEFEKEKNDLKQDLVNLQSEITELKRTIVTNEQYTTCNEDQQKKIKFLTRLLFIILGLVSAGLIFSLVVFILTVLP